MNTNELSDNALEFLRAYLEPVPKLLWVRNRNRFNVYALVLFSDGNALCHKNRDIPVIPSQLGYQLARVTNLVWEAYNNKPTPQMVMDYGYPGDCEYEVRMVIGHLSRKLYNDPYKIRLEEIKL